LRRQIHRHVDRRHSIGRCDGSADEAAAPDRGLDQAAPPGFGKSAADRGEIDLQPRREIALGRQAVASSRATAGDIGFQRVGDGEIKWAGSLAKVGYPDAVRAHHGAIRLRCSLLPAAIRHWSAAINSIIYIQC
jgi:hypothetical protein